MNATDEYFVKLKFENDKDITKEQLNDALVKNNYIYIEMYNTHCAPKINIPDEIPFSGGIIYITSKATSQSTIYVSNEQHTLSKNEELVVLGSPTKEWIAVVPAPSLTKS
ncbi:hypothetical protein [Klebsiella sp. BIGb0407]|uniref:hypothetical protein n=1 Tax=Klebsiella sp. BIGb0407 TaxID=2940603 RepID=UPI002169EC44|nr:hypothetical protein [Klebsiella sp. BIGb0407]MCS3433044.1 hypothetical protein [Klebsiella sp. BIGb0407]